MWYWRCGIAEMLWWWTGECCSPLQINCGHEKLQGLAYLTAHLSWIFVLLAVWLFGLYSFLCVRGVKIGAAVLKFTNYCAIIILIKTV